jgi:serine phosphatase RsbU (regulator of sigma subunit)/pSer/pThr/pTyr-binding forkhead associated (FHA) protein
MSLKEITLRVEPLGREPYEHRVSGDELVIGRSSGSGLVIPDPYLSRRQARLYRAVDGWYLEDLGGRNPTLLNGVPVTRPTGLSVGDLIKMSETLLRVAPAREVGPTSEAQTADDSGAVYRPASTMIERSQVFDPAQGGEAGLRRQGDRLRLLNEVHRILARPITLEELLRLILDRVFAELVPEEAVIFLKDARGEFYRAATRRMPGVSGDFLYSSSLVREVTEKQLAALVFDMSRDERFAAAPSMVASGVRSLVAAPLLDTEGCPGMIVLSSRANIRQFSEDDMELLVSLASVAALRIRNIALAEDTARRRALEKEMELARAIQIGLLPESLPQVAGYELRASNAPSRAVSGDLYQAQLRGEGRECVFLVVDVSGKGMAAALLTASLEALAVGPIEVGLPADEICAKLSRRLYARTSPERYATAFVAVLDPERHTLRYANAGHNPPLLLRAAGGSASLPATGLPLGLLPIADYTAEEVSLAPGDTLIVYTDGITEAANPEGEEYGLARVEQTVRRGLGGSLEQVLEGLEQDLEGFVRGVPYGDDRTLLVLRRSPLA